MQLHSLIKKRSLKEYINNVEKIQIDKRTLNDFSLGITCLTQAIVHKASIFARQRRRASIHAHDIADVLDLLTPKDTSTK